MSIGREQDLRQRLDRAFGAVAPRPAPVDGAIRQGRAIRARRWVAAAAGIAMAAAAVAVPLALRNQAAPSSVTPRPRHHTVTVHPAGPHAPAGLIAWGRVDRRHWVVRAGKPYPSGPFKGSQYISGVGGGVYAPAMTSSGPDPASFQDLYDGPAAANQLMAVYGPVRADVTYMQARLSDGTVLTLHPVRVNGVRFVAFAAPTFMIGKITAYSARGALAATVPLHGPHGSLLFNQWLRPGQAGLPRRSWAIGAGTTAGVSWSIGVYQGPWGYCILTVRSRSNTGACYNRPAELSGSGVMGQGGSGAPQLIWGTAPPRAARVVVVMSDHSRVRVRTVTAGQLRYFAFAVASARLRVTRWMAYDQARHGVGHG